MSREEIEQVENLVNEKIREEIAVRTDVMGLEEAKKTGAMALFGEKYGEKVRVVSMGDFSVEFCGGTHVKNTGEIQAFKIVGESGVAAGVRRIDVVEHAKKLQEEIKALNSEIESMKAKAAKESLGDAASDAALVNGVSVVVKGLKDVDMNGLRDLGDSLKEKLPTSVIVLASENDGKVSLMVTATEAAIKMGAHAGNVVREAAKLVGGGGGGRPNMAQAGGKNPAGIKDALDKAVEVLKNQIK